MVKDFDKWNEKKKKIDALAQQSIKLFKEQEIWFVSIGLNVGYEVYGKGKPGHYSRPVLVLKKHNRHTFYGLPLGSTVKLNNPNYFPITTNSRKGSILLTQGRTFSSKRMIARMIKLSDPLFEEIKQAYKAQY